MLEGSSKSAGTIEQIVNGVREAAVEKETAFGDTFETYLHLTPEQIADYYSDTVHPKPAGLRFIGDLLFAGLYKSLPIDAQSR